MQNQTVILQPTASELFKFLKLSSEDENTSVKFTVEIISLSKYMTVKEVANLIGCERSLLYKLDKKGKLTHNHFKLHKKMYLRNDVLKFLENEEI